MDRIELTRQCGFRLPLTKLPEHFQGLAIRCSFDRDGLYLLPQNHPILLPKEKQIKQIHAFSHGDPGELASNETETSSDELQTHWEELEMLRLILDEVENKLDIRDREAAEKLTRNKTWIAKLLQPR
jgi:hypothetical protein